MKNSIHHILTITLVLFALMFLTSCQKEPEYVFYSHEEVHRFTVGESIRIDPSELTNIPEGHSADEYKWDLTGSSCNIAGDGTVTAEKPGTCGVVARLRVKNVMHNETFNIIVDPRREVFMIDPQEITIILSENNGLYTPGDSQLLNIVTDEPLAYNEKLEWKSSDPDIVEISPASFTQGVPDKTSVMVTGKNEGSADIFASVGEKFLTSAHVTVTRNNVGPDQILSFLSERADENLITAGKTAFIDTDDAGCTIMPAGEPGGGGKYLVEVERGLGGKKYNPEKTYAIGNTILLPKGIRAASMDDVSYIIRVQEIEPEKGWNYTNGVQGWYRIIEIRLVDAMTEEVLETWYSGNGQLEFEYRLADGTTDVYTTLPDLKYVYYSLYSKIADFWLEQYDNIVFYDHSGRGEKVFGKPGPTGKSAHFCYGEGMITFPDELGFTVLDLPESDNISGFELSGNMELNTPALTGWKNYLIRVPAGSETEKHLQRHKMDYEVIE